MGGERRHKRRRVGQDQLVYQPVTFVATRDGDGDDGGRRRKETRGWRKNNTKKKKKAMKKKEKEKIRSFAVCRLQLRCTRSCLWYCCGLGCIVREAGT